MKSEIYREVLKQLEPGDYALADTLMILTHPVIEASPGFDPKVES